MPHVNIGTETFPCPMPTVIVGSVRAGRANFMAAAWWTRVKLKPVILAVCINERHHTPGCIREGRAFSLCVPGSALLARTDYVGLVSGAREDKSGVFTVFYGETGAPLIGECGLNVECRLVDEKSMGSHTLFFGEVAAVFAEESILRDGAPDPALPDPLLLTMPDNRYWRLGEPVGRAWHDGKALRKGGGGPAGEG